MWNACHQHAAPLHHCSSLAGQGLSGTLPASVAGVSQLQTLDLADNSLGSTLPPTLQSSSLKVRQCDTPYPPLRRSPGHTHMHLVATKTYMQSCSRSCSSLLPPQTLLLDNNKLTGALPASWAGALPALATLGLQGNNLASTMPPGWVAAAGFAPAFAAAVQPGNALLCGAVAPVPSHTLLYNDSTSQHAVITTLGSCAQGQCGQAAANASAPNLYDLAWSNRIAPLDLQQFNPTVQNSGQPPLQGTPVTLPCYPSNAPTYFGGDAAVGKAAWQGPATAGAATPNLPISGVVNPTRPADCSATQGGAGYWMVDLQVETQVLAVLVSASSFQMAGLAVRVSATPEPTAGVACVENATFVPGAGAIYPCVTAPKVGGWGHGVIASACD